MLDFCYKKDPKTGQCYIETSLSGKPLLTTPQLNKSTAFNYEERREFGLLGKLPPRIETLQEQVNRTYQQFNTFDTFLEKNIYLNNIHNINQIVFYALLEQHLEEMLPVIYTPIVGTAVKSFSKEFRKARGLYISYPERDYMDEILDNRSNPEIDIIVVTDGEGVLGIGDQGVGGMDIPIAKLMVYSICGGIDPTRTLPIQLDVGTNNQELLAEPLYLGWREKRIHGKAYDDFVETFIQSVKRKFPNAFLHWEDLGRGNARRVLDKYRDQLCTFNDDIQGTGAVCLAAIIAALKHKHETFADQRIVIFGAGSAGTGIAEQIALAMQNASMAEQDIYDKFWLVDRQGLLMDDMPDLTDMQKIFACHPEQIKNWVNDDKNCMTLAEVVANVKPTILIGCSSQPGTFTETIIKTMASHVTLPVIMPLSNPTERVEAHPKDILEWTHGKALIATGSPFEPINFNGKEVKIAQCNNALIFPGIGLGIVAVQAKRCTDSMLLAACDALSDFAPINQQQDSPLLPSLANAREAAKQIAIAVARQAIKEGLSDMDSHTDLNTLITERMWYPHYLPMKYKHP